MKHMYLRLFSATIFLSFIIACQTNTYAQCPDGQPAGATAFDTTIRFGSGIVVTDVKFPKFDPQNGMVTCVRLCVTIKGIIDTIAMENYTNAPQTGSYTYIRKDTITGPGIATQLTSSANISSPSFPLAANDGVFFSGPDFYSQGPDTVLTRVLCSNISDSATISQFYGVNDSVKYNYRVDAILNDQVTGGSAFKFVLSSALVNFHFEYCTCPAEVLPLNVRRFDINKITESVAELKWSGYDDMFANYHYEVELSRDGHSFISINSFTKHNDGNESYKMTYTVPNAENGVFYFRIKQVYSNGYVRYSNIKQVTLGSSSNVKFLVSPNPSTGIVGIKFDNSTSGHFNIKIYNAQGQMVVSKEVVVNGSSYMEVANLKSGIYWLRLIDKKSQTSSATQLLIK